MNAEVHYNKLYVTFYLQKRKNSTFYISMWMTMHAMCAPIYLNVIDSKLQTSSPRRNIFYAS